MLDDTMTSFERAKDYMEKAEEYYEMCFQEWKNGNWTDEQRKEFARLLFKTLEHSSMDFRNKI